MTAALALEFDRVALLGSGAAPEPRGVFNTVGIASVSMGANGAALTNYDNFVDLVRTIADANAAATAMVMAPRTQGSLAKLKDTTNQPLVAPAYLSEIPNLKTTSIPVNQTQGTSNDCSSVIAGDWSQLLLGIRQGLRLQVLRETYMGNMQIGFLAHMRADVQVEHPAAFGKLIGIRP